MSEQMVLTVLNEVLGELKEANKSLKEMDGTIKALEGRVTGFEQMLKDQQVVIQPPDLEPAFGEIRQLTTETAVAASKTIGSVQNEAKEMLALVGVTVAQKLSEIQAGIDGRLAEQPKPVIRQWRVSFFPESDKAGSYKYLIRWLFGGTVLALLVGTLFSLGRQYLDKWHPSPNEPRQSMSIPFERPEGNVKPAVPSVVRHQEWMASEEALMKKKLKVADSLGNYYIRQLEDSVRRNGGKQPQKTDRSAVATDSFVNINK